MRYLLLIYRSEAAMQVATREAAAQTTAAYAAYTDALSQAGLYIGGNRLQPTASAKTVRVSQGRISAVDGPYTETKEQLGGYYLIEAPDLETAVAWAARCPGAAYGAMEVRAVWSE